MAIGANASNDGGSSAEKPDATGLVCSPLSHLTAQSSRFIVCGVAIFNPTARKREYVYASQKRTGYHFQCMLFSTEDTDALLGYESD